MLVYRGLNSRYYYKDENKDPDFISEYAATEFDQHYHETNLLTSYTISFSVAEQFMNMRKSQRRAFIHGSMDIVLGRIFSSFVVEPSFVKDQFEMLCTQNDYPILISNLCNYEPIDESYDEKNNEITADFMLMRG
jgi:hypothetical protein